jgi:predicted DNA-binding protein with PD1-like motif
MIEVSFAALHEPLFLGGKNFEKKLDPYRYQGLKLEYDLKEKELHITWATHFARMPSTNVAYYVPGKPTDRKIQQSAHPMVAGIGATAQVESPMQHVHAGPGHGKTGIGGKVK